MTNAVPWPAASVESIAIVDLIPYAENSRTHSPAQIRDIAGSLREWGWTQPVLRDEQSTILVGHGRVLAAKLLVDQGLDAYAFAPVVTARGWSEAQKRAYVIADNRIAQSAGWDRNLLASELQALNIVGFDLGLLGFGRGELRKLTGLGGKTPVDQAPPAPAVPMSRRGDLWRLGVHRVLCGDSTSAADVDRLMAGDLADMVWTDPPYNIAVDGKAGTILNDDMSGAAFAAFLRQVYARCHAAMRPGAAIYVAHGESERETFTREFAGAGFKLSQVRIWVKQTATLSRQDYNWQHEPILYGWKEGERHYFAGDFTKTTVTETDLDLAKMKAPELRLLVARLQALVQSSIIRQDRPHRSDLHPTMKPVALVEEMIDLSSKEGWLVLDLFGRAGSTLIACTTLGRRARLMELDPRFVDVIVQRWQDFTGEQATHEREGATFDQICAARRRERTAGEDDAAWA